MISKFEWLGIGTALLFLTLPGILAGAEDKPRREKPSIIGRWDLSVQDQHGEYPSWLEVRRSGHRTLVGSFVGQFGSARPISRVEFADGEVRFSVPPQWEEGKNDLAFEGRFQGDVLRGETTDANGKRLRWTGRRAPTLKRAAPPHWGRPVPLLDGKDLTGWKPRSAKGKNSWTVRGGILVNTVAGTDLMTHAKFTDFKLHAEFRYPRGSNSGIYLRGRYEVQIEDDPEGDPDCHSMGAVYGFLTPSINAAKRAGQWQAIDITLVGRIVTVVLNGERIIDRQVIPGITGGALESDEGAPGPILLQGDHGPIEFRNLILTPSSISKSK
jgi:hypothetical protein